MQRIKLLAIAIALLLAALPFGSSDAQAQPLQSPDCVTVFGSPVPAFPPISQTDCDALEALYNATAGPTWTNNTGWGPANGAVPVHPCDWFGITCEPLDGRATVTNIELGGNGLQGQIPAEVGDFAALRSLSLHSNSVAGEIPNEIANLAGLELLLLFGMDLAGEIPAELGALGNLKVLILADNNLAGTIPEALGDLGALGRLDLSGNGLTGSIPAEFGLLSNLLWLDLRANQLEGIVPLEVMDPPNLNVLFLEQNGCLVGDEATVTLSRSATPAAWRSGAKHCPTSVQSHPSTRC